MTSDSISRRSLIRRAAATGAIAWSAPVIIDSLASPAGAITACSTICYRFGIQAAASGSPCPTDSPNEPKINCDPATPPGCTTAFKDTWVKDEGPLNTYLPWYGITYNTTLSQDNCTIDAGAGTCTGGTPVSSLSNNCAVPSGGDGTSVINRKRVWEWNPAAWNNPPGEPTCTNPTLWSSTVAVKGKDTPDYCCSYNGTQPGAPVCRPTGTFGGVPSQANNFVNVSALGGGGLRIEYILDGRLKANASQSGAYQFFIGCDCN